MKLSESPVKRGFEKFSPQELAEICSKVKKVAVVSTLWYPEILEGLRQSSITFLNEVGVKPESIIDLRVPGAFELPLGVSQALPCDFVVALGCVVQGDTPHFEYVCQAATQGLMQVQLQHKVPVGFGLLTVNNLQQAEERKDKGAEAAHAALMMYLQSQGFGFQK